MNKTISIFIGLLFLSVSYLIYRDVTADKVTKVCYINITKVFEKFAGMKDSRVVFEDSKKKWGDTLDVLFKKIQEKTNTGSSASNNVEQLESVRIYNRYREIVENRAREQENELTKEVLLQVKSFSGKFAENHKYDFVIASDDYGMVFYYQKDMDKTDLFISELNGYYYSKKK